MRATLLLFAIIAVTPFCHGSRSLFAQPAATTPSKESQTHAVLQGSLVRPKSGEKHPDLDQAWDDYGSAIDSAHAQIRTAITKQFDAATAEGDLDAAEKWQTALSTFDSSGAVPSDPAIKTPARDADTNARKAREQLTEAYDALVKSLTREKNVKQAKAVRDEMRAIAASSQRAAPEPAPNGNRKEAQMRPAPPQDAVAAKKEVKADETMVYEEAAAECKRLVEQQRAELAKQYSAALWGLKEQFQQIGELDKAIATDNELKRSTNGEPLTPDVIVDEPEELKRVQQEYLSKWGKVDAQTASAFLDKLNEEASRLAKKGKLAEGRVLQQQATKIKQAYLAEKKRNVDGDAGVMNDPTSACEESIRERRKALQSQYVGELEAMEKSFQAQGALESVFAAKAEKDRFVNTPLLAERNLVKSPESLRSLQGSYLEQFRGLAEVIATDFIERLEQRKQSLTIEGDLAGATRIKAEIEKIRARHINPKPSQAKSTSLLIRDRLTVVQGQWNFVADQLTFGDERKDGMLRVDTRAKGDFRVEIDATPARVAPTTLICLYFRRGDREFAVQLAEDGSCVITGGIDPRAQRKARYGQVWEGGKMSRITYEVRGNVLSVLVNGNPFLEYKGDDVRGAETTGFAIGILGEWSISRLDLTPLP